jgi:hypothetical protein
MSWPWCTSKKRNLQRDKRKTNFGGTVYTIYSVYYTICTVYSVYTICTVYGAWGVYTIVMLADSAGIFKSEVKLFLPAYLNLLYITVCFLLGGSVCWLYVSTVIWSGVNLRKLTFVRSSAFHAHTLKGRCPKTFLFAAAEELEAC